MNKRKILCGIALVLILIIGFFVAVYTQRNAIIEKVAKGKLEQVAKERNIDISFSSMKIDGLSDLDISGLRISQPSDTLFAYFDNIHCRLSILNLLRKDVVLNELDVDSLYVHLYDVDGHRNFDFIRKKSSEDEDSQEEESKTSIYEKISQIMTKVFDLVPDELKIHKIHVLCQHNKHYADLYMPNLTVCDKHYESQMTLQCDSSEAQKIIVSGEFNNRDKSLEFKAYTGNPLVKMVAPFLEEKMKAKIKCDTLKGSFRVADEGSNHLDLQGSVAVSNLSVDYFRLANREINVGNGSLDYQLRLNSDYIELDSSSVARFNKLSFNPYLRVRLKPSIEVTASVNKNEFDSAELFGSLPNGLFSNLDSIQTEGHLNYHLFFQLDTAAVDSLIFESSLNKCSDFKIVHLGHTDFRDVSNQFLYHAYDENGNLVRSFYIGPDWEHYTPVDSISPYLKSAVLLSEDGHFFLHKGFYDGAIRYAIIQNIKQGRFARGGSTISMQLVKNVFLNKNKNIMRKMEEILIVWLIENERLLSKQRMFEIYLNIVEWGPKVYGAEEAAQFYFGKHAYQLNPSESIYLASIIPSPKKFMYWFVSTHEMKKKMDYYLRVVGRKMFANGVISAEQLETLSRENIQVVGPARGYLPQPKVEVESEESDDDGESLIDLEE